MMQKKSKPDHMDVNDACQKPQGDRETPGQDRQSWPLPMADAALVKPGTGPTWAADPDRQPTGGKPLSKAALERREMDLVGGLSDPRPMPWLAWSIPAERCKVGSRLRKVSGSVCSGCYALKGYYSYPVVRAAMERRYGFLADLDSWATDMADCLVARAARFHPTPEDPWPAFRWFDSGDLQSVEHLQAICRVAKMTQGVTLANGAVEDIRHWLPTHEYPVVREFVAQGGVFPRNLCVRVSAPMIDGKPLDLAGLPVSTTHSRPVSEVYPEAFACPSDAQGGCGPCRACWDRDVRHVSYPAH